MYIKIYTLEIYRCVIIPKRNLETIVKKKDLNNIKKWINGILEGLIFLYLRRCI